MVNVIIAGSRDFTDEKFLRDKASAWAGFNTDAPMPASDITVICGGAKGPDKMGAEWAEFHGINVRHMPADWNAHGRAAGPIRNAAMADIGDVLIAFYDGKSKGTANMIGAALRKGLELHIYQIKD